MIKSNHKEAIDRLTCVLDNLYAEEEAMGTASYYCGLTFRIKRIIAELKQKEVKK